MILRWALTVCVLGLCINSRAAVPKKLNSVSSKKALTVQQRKKLQGVLKEAVKVLKKTPKMAKKNLRTGN